MSTIRGEHALEIVLSWRMDAGDLPEIGDDAPLVLALHGMGMDEDSFAALLGGLRALPLRILLPRGPYPVEVRGEGRIGGSWYAYDGDQDRFRHELIRTEGILLALLRDVEAAHGLRPRARFLLGFSQGGYCGAFAALRHPEVFRGMIICGARVKTEFLEDAMPKAAARDFRVLLCHGRRDMAVSFESAERGRDGLRQAGIDVELAEFDAGHSLGRAQVEAAAQWIQRIVSPPRSSDASEQPPIHR